MKYQKFSPPPALAEFVRSFWMLEGEAREFSSAPYRVFADGCPGLLVQYGNCFADYTEDGSLVTVPTCFFQGQTYSHRETTVTGNFGLIGAYFYPYVVPLLCNTSGRELTNQTLEAALLFGASIHELEEKMLSASDSRERLTLFTDFLCARFRMVGNADCSFRACVRQLVHARGRASVESLAADTGLSFRQLERKFLHTTGLSPKLLSRILRFQSTITEVPSSQVKSLTDLAYASGYSDQSHFIREFREFAGMNPRQYFTSSGDTADNFILLPE